MTTNLERTPWASPVSYWHPPRIVPSGWLEHGPFAFWLMSVLRPSTVVELGTHNGYSFFTFCEAARRLGLDSRLSAIDTWQGDEHAGFYGEEIYADVLAVKESLYDSSAVLLRGFFSDYVDTFAEASIDLLHIDGRHGYDDVKEDFESWVPKVANHGIVLLHDIAVLDRGFGVHQFWAELEQRYPATLAFHHGNGLGVVAVGEPPAALSGLFDAGQADAIRAFYAERGASVTAVMVERQAHLAELEAQRTAFAAEIDAIRQSTSWRVTAPLRAVGKLLGR